MKLTESQLRFIIRKELRSVLNEVEADEILPADNMTRQLNIEQAIENFKKFNYKPQDIADVFFSTIMDLDKLKEPLQIEEIIETIKQLGPNTGIEQILYTSNNLKNTIKLIKNQLEAKMQQLQRSIPIDVKSTEVHPSSARITSKQSQSSNVETPAAQQIDKQQVSERIEQLKNLKIPDTFDEDSVNDLKNQIIAIPAARSFENPNRRLIISLQNKLLDSIQIGASKQTVQQNLNNLISKLQEFIRL